ncbi:mitogen activated protein kinase, partial [Cryomyces antarcticus]
SISILGWSTVCEYFASCLGFGRIQLPSDSMSRTQPPSGSRKISFNVSEQYDIQDVVGEGAYGVVW